MKKAFLLVCCWVFCAMAGDLPSIRDFGAIGDGKHDDTEAIQKAADAVIKKLSRHGSATLYFPKGYYKISKQINLSRIHLRGDSAVIIQSKPDEDVFYYDFAWNTRVTGIEFKGGRNQLSFWNANTEKGQITVRDCRFFNASGIAVQTRLGSNSTIFTVANCVFYKCDQAIISHCDWTSIRDIWLTSSSKMRKKAVILNGHGVMTIDNMLGVPLCNGDEQRWVDNYGSLFATSTRFGGEGGGFTPVYNFAKYHAIGIPSVVSIVRCWNFAGSSANAPGVVYCVEVPNQINVSECAGDTQPVIIAPKIDLKNYFYVNPQRLRFTTNNVGTGSNDIPEGLKNPVVHPVRPANQISMEQTKKLAANVMPPSAEVTPAEIDLQKNGAYQWAVDEYMDGSELLNSEYLHLVRRGDRVGIMRRVPGSTAPEWPHVTIRNIEVDVRKYPYLAVDPVSASPAQFCVKIVVPEKKKLFAVMRRQNPLHKLELNLLERFPELAEHPRFTMLIYYMPVTYIPPKQNQEPEHRYADTGSSLWFRTIGFNSKASAPADK